jgi:hypothetical protein
MRQYASGITTPPLYTFQSAGMSIPVAANSPARRSPGPVCLLGPEYPARIWTTFESQQFQERFSQGAVIPIWFKNAPPSMFDQSRKVGGLSFDSSIDVEHQLEEIADTLSKKMAERAQTTKLTFTL